MTFRAESPSHCGSHPRRRMMLPARSDVPTALERRVPIVESVVGIVLIVLSALEIWFIVRTVQANMVRG